MNKKRYCDNCGDELQFKHNKKYCSNTCQHESQYKKWIIMWKNGEKNGNVGINVRAVSGSLKKYLREKYSNRCSICNWDKKHPITGMVPLEVDHIDGNSENNKEKNLRLLCPNYHSLTTHFRNLNKGSGRKWRQEKYLKNGTN